MTHRKHRHAFGTVTLTVTACLLLWGFQLPAWAGDATRVEPLALRKIMQELGRNMQAITDAISREEWVQVSLRVKVSELGRIRAEVSKDAHFFSKRWLGGGLQLLGRAESRSGAGDEACCCEQRRQGGDPIIRPCAGKLLGLSPSFP